MTARFPPWLVAAAGGDVGYRLWCADALRAYFGRRPDGRPAYSGARFELLGPTDRNRVEPLDLVAVSMLGVDVSGHAALGLLELAAERITELLRSIPADVDLHDAPAGLVDRGSCAERLWALVRGEDDMGPVRTSKLLARKRPRLLPVFDEVVRDVLGLRDARDHWLELHDLLRAAPAVVTLLDDLHAEADLPGPVSTLRVLDVLLWMSHPRRLPPPASAPEVALVGAPLSHEFIG